MRRFISRWMAVCRRPSSFLYGGPVMLTSNSTVTASAFEANYNNSVAVNAIYFVRPPVQFLAPYFSNQQFVLPISGISGKSYVLQATTNFVDWVPLGTNVAGSDVFMLMDTNSAQIPYPILSRGGAAVGSRVFNHG